MVEGNWGVLVEMFESETERRELRQGRRREQTDDEIAAQRAKEVLKLLMAGQLGKAMHRVTSYGVADMAKPAVLRQLQEKFPPKVHSLPATVPKVAAVNSFRDLKENLLSLTPGTSPGSGGCRPEYLVALGERMEPEELVLLEQFGLAYLSGELPAWFYQLWLSMEAVPLFKDEDLVDVRPLAIRHTLSRLFHREVADQCKEEVRAFLEPQQLGQSKAGAAKLVTSVRSLLDLHEDWVCVALDVKNCYNSMSRKAILDVILNTPELQHLATFAAVILAAEPALESRGKVWGVSATGAAQGDPWSGQGVALGLQPSLVLLDDECGQGGGAARAGADDVLAVGPAQIVLPAIQNFEREIRERCNLSLQWRKSKIFCRDGVLPAGAAEL